MSIQGANPNIAMPIITLCWGSHPNLRRNGHPGHSETDVLIYRNALNVFVDAMSERIVIPAFAGMTSVGLLAGGNFLKLNLISPDAQP